MPVPVISVEQMREWETATWNSGQTEAEVIRRVGKHLADAASRMTSAGDLILILAGKGNNGADALQTREFLSERKVEVLNITDPAANLAKLEIALAARPALIIDGLFGIGLNRSLSPEWAKFIEVLNASNRPVLAVDVPSGLNADTGQPQPAAVVARVTLTVGAPKAGCMQPPAWPFVGRLEVADEVGFAPCPSVTELSWTLASDFQGFPPVRAVAGHKGTYGHLAIIAGSVGFHGAAVLAAKGAERAQPGLITLHTHEPVYHSVSAQLRQTMVSPTLPATRQLGNYSALLAGPGLGAPDAKEFAEAIVRQAWREAQVPVVIDASALDWLGADSFPKNAIRVVTPHPGEAARILRSTSSAAQVDRVATLRQVSRRLNNCIVVLKGHQTLVGRSIGEIFVNSSGNPHLAQGGSGDLLGGYIAGLLAQPSLRSDPIHTVRYAVWQHGASADHLQSRSRNWTIDELSQELGNCSGDRIVPAETISA
jgi:NAD(P)H-hydrate epimerase